MARKQIIALLGVALVLLLALAALFSSRIGVPGSKTMQATPTPTPLLDLLHPNASQGWVSVPLSDPAGLVFSASDPGIGYLCLKKGNVAAALQITTDGGKTWRALPALPAGAGCVRQINPTNADDLLLDGTHKASALAFRSLDGGQHWTKIAAPFKAADTAYYLTIQDVTFVSGAYFLSVSQDGASDATKYAHADHLVKLTPATITELQTPLAAGRDIGYLFGVGSHVFVGSDCASGCAIFASNDGGAGWTKTTLPASGPDRLDYYLTSAEQYLIHIAISGNVFLTSAPHQVICEYSADLGETWNALPELPVHLDSSHAYTNFSANRLIMTTDGTVYGSFYQLSSAGQNGFSTSLYRLAPDHMTWQAIPLPDSAQVVPTESQVPLVISEDRARHPNALWLLRSTLSYRAA